MKVDNFDLRINSLSYIGKRKILLTRTFMHNFKKMNNDHLFILKIPIAYAV